MIRILVWIWDRLRGAWRGLIVGFLELTTCPLTGVLKREVILQIGEREVRRAKRYYRRLAVVVMDLNRFKPINDELGHPIGDLVLMEVGRVLHACIRKEDYVGRTGGDEFVLIFPETSQEGAETAAQRCMEAIRENLEVIGFSYGVWGRALDETCDETFADFIHYADDRMYQDKCASRQSEG